MADWLASNVVKNGIVAGLLEVLIQIWLNIVSPMLGLNISLEMSQRLSYSAGLVQIVSSAMFWVFAIGLAIRVVRISGKP